MKNVDLDAIGFELLNISQQLELLKECINANSWIRNKDITVFLHLYNNFENLYYNQLDAIVGKLDSLSYELTNE